MSKAAKKIRQSKRLVSRQKRKLEKRARYASTQEQRHRVKRTAAGKWRGIRRKPTRNRSHRSLITGACTMTLKAFVRNLSMNPA